MVNHRRGTRFEFLTRLLLFVGNYINPVARSFQVCITFGLTYNGKNQDGSSRWDGCANVKLRRFETATQFNHYILSFNINTNHWCAEYIYKRLKFLGSKIYSQLLTLLFLALWHGFHSGYYHCFFMEFIVMYFERDVSYKMQTVERLNAIVCLLILFILIF